MKKIMFNDKYGLTTAVLEGRKTMTRRIVPDGTPLGNWSETVKHSKYQQGEVVAIAESYETIYDRMEATVGNSKANAWWVELANQSDRNPQLLTGFKNKMFVKAEFMTNRIRIKDICIERLQDISDKDCLREGITMMTEGKIEIGNAYGWDTKIDALKRDSFFTPRAAFAALIDKVSGRGTWDSNPWVWVYQFELLPPNT